MESAERPEESLPSLLPAGLIAAAAVGLAFGLASGALLWANYPPGKHMAWVPAAISIGSALMVAATYAVVALYLELRATADWLVAGWLIAILLLAGLELTSETVTLVRNHVPSAIGMKTGAVVPPRRRAST